MVFTETLLVDIYLDIYVIVDINSMSVCFFLLNNIRDTEKCFISCHAYIT